MFSISDKVVCVDAVPSDSALAGHYVYPNGYVVHSHVYVIAGFRQATVRSGTYLCLILVGLPALQALPSNVTAKHGEDVGWLATRFRKLSEVQAENAAQRAISSELSIDNTTSV